MEASVDHHWSSDGMSGGDELENWNSQISIEYHPKIHQKIRCSEFFVLFFPLIHVKLHPFENEQQQKTLICLLRCFLRNIFPTWQLHGDEYHGRP